MAKTFKLQINVINGELREFPETFVFNCSEVVPEGITIIRYFNEDMCSVAHRTFYLRVGQDLFGTNQFQTMNDFNRFRKTVCVTYDTTIDGCQIYIGDEKVNFL